jgi:hypothetical protein
MNESKKIQQNDPLNDPNREYIVGLIKAIGGVEKTISDLNNSPTVTLMKSLQEKLEGGSDIASFMWSLLRGPKGEQGEKGESIKGDRGEPGIQGIPGKNADDEAIYRRLLKMIPDPIPGKKGEKGDPGKDAVVDYAKIINDVLTKIPKDKELKKEILKLSSKDIADLPDLVKKYIYEFSQERGATIVAPGASHLRTLADVNVKDLAVGYVPVWNGTQFVFEAKGSGSGSSAWGDLTGLISDQTDLQAELDGKSDVGHDHSGVYEPANANIQSHISNTSNPHSVTKTQVGLGNVDNTSDANKPISSATQTALDAKQNSLGFTPENSANKGQNNGYASLDSGGKVPSAQLPSFVDDVIESANFASLPGTGETGKIYVTLDNNKTYRWSGSAYVEISPSPGSTDSVTEGSTNLYFTVARVLASALTGFSVGSRVAITASDTVLSAFGKAQKYFNDLSALAFSGSASDLTGTKTSSFISDFSTAVAGLITGKSDVGHTHSASDITSGTKTSSFISDFSSAVASLITGKSDVGHVHSASDITSGTKTSSFISDFSSAVASLITGKLDSSAYDDATSAETTTGTSTSKYVSPDGLAGSDYGKRIVGILVVDPATDVATGDGKAFFRIPSALNGYNLVGVAMNVYTAGTTGTMDVQIRNVTDSQDMLSTKLTIDSTETDTSTAVTPAVINTSFDDVATGDKISIDVDAVQTTKAKGLYVELIFQLP